MNKVKRIIDVTMKYLGVVIMSVMVLLVLFQVFTRYVLNKPSGFSEVLTRYMFVWLVIVTATYVFGQREHMCINYLKDKIKGVGKKVLNTIIELLTLLFAGSIMVYGGSVITKMQMSQIDSTLKIPLGYIYSIIPVCGIIVVFYCLYNIYLEFSKKEETIEGGTK